MRKRLDKKGRKTARALERVNLPLGLHSRTRGFANHVSRRRSPREDEYIGWGALADLLSCDIRRLEQR